jgi:hypothetical protein
MSASPPHNTVWTWLHPAEVLRQFWGPSERLEELVKEERAEVRDSSCVQVKAPPSASRRDRRGVGRGRSGACQCVRWCSGGVRLRGPSRGQRGPWPKSVRRSVGPAAAGRTRRWGRTGRRSGRGHTRTVFGRETQAVAELTFSVDEVGLQPVQGLVGQETGLHLDRGRADDNGAGCEDGLVVAQDLAVRPAGCTPRLLRTHGMAHIVDRCAPHRAVFLADRPDLGPSLG